MSIAQGRRADRPPAIPRAADGRLHASIAPGYWHSAEDLQHGSAHAKSIARASSCSRCGLHGWDVSKPDSIARRFWPGRIRRRAPHLAPMASALANCAATSYRRPVQADVDIATSGWLVASSRPRGRRCVGTRVPLARSIQRSRMSLFPRRPAPATAPDVAAPRPAPPRGDAARAHRTSNSSPCRFPGSKLAVSRLRSTALHSEPDASPPWLRASELSSCTKRSTPTHLRARCRDRCRPR